MKYFGRLNSILPFPSGLIFSKERALFGLDQSELDILDQSEISSQKGLNCDMNSILEDSLLERIENERLEKTSIEYFTETIKKYENNQKILNFISFILAKNKKYSISLRILF